MSKRVEGKNGEVEDRKSRAKSQMLKFKGR